MSKVGIRGIKNKVATKSFVRSIKLETTVARNSVLVSEIAKNKGVNAVTVTEVRPKKTI